jgi:hypothetical protein
MLGLKSTFLSPGIRLGKRGKTGSEILTPVIKTNPLNKTGIPNKEKQPEVFSAKDVNEINTVSHIPAARPDLKITAAFSSDSTTQSMFSESGRITY